MLYICLLFKDYFLFILQLIEFLGFYIKKKVLTSQLDMNNNAISALCTCNLEFMDKKTLSLDKYCQGKFF